MAKPSPHFTRQNYLYESGQGSFDEHLKNLQANNPLTYDNVNFILDILAASPFQEGTVTTGTQSFSGNKTIRALLKVADSTGANGITFGHNSFNGQITTDGKLQILSDTDFEQPVRARQTLQIVDNVTNSQNIQFDHDGTIGQIDCDGHLVFTPLVDFNNGVQFKADTQFDESVLFASSLAPPLAASAPTLANHLCRKSYVDAQVGSSIKICFLKDRKPNNTNAGGSSALTWTSRYLNTSEGDLADILVSPYIVGNYYFTIFGPGKYYIEGRAPCFKTDGGAVRLWNQTSSNVDLIGSGGFSDNGDFTQDYGILKGVITLATNQIYTLQQSFYYAVSNYGMGRAADCGQDEEYTQIMIMKIG